MRIRNKQSIYLLILICGIWVCGMWSNAALAVVVKGLYEAEVPVLDQGNEERDRAMTIGLAEVIGKVTGDARAAGYEAVLKATKNPSKFVQQFRYRRIQKNYQGVVMPEATRMAWFRFDERAVNKMLQKTGLPVWGKTRPVALAWIAVEQDGARFILGGEANEDLRAMLEFEAKRRGLALLLPLMDLEDQQTITFSDVWGEIQVAINKASARYQADAVLVGKLSLSPTDEWQVVWSLFESGSHLRWEGQYPLINDALESGVAGSLDLLARRYAQVFTEDQPGEIELSVGGVTSLHDFARLSKYLKSLGQVKAIYPTRIEPRAVSFRLDIRGDSEGLRQTIALGNTLSKLNIIPDTAPVQMVDPEMTPDSTQITVPGETGSMPIEVIPAVTGLHYELLP